jgi:hypothetical protein
VAYSECCGSGPTLRENTNEIDYSIRHSSGSYVRGRYPVSRAGGQASRSGLGAAFNSKKIEMKDKGEVAYLLSFTAGKEFEATTDGLKNTDVHLFVYDSSSREVAKDDSPGPDRSVRLRSRPRRTGSTSSSSGTPAGPTR